jgi:hypothetical protein
MYNGTENPPKTGSLSCNYKLQEFLTCFFDADKRSVTAGVGTYGNSKWGHFPIIQNGQNKKTMMKIKYIYIPLDKALVEAEIILSDVIMRDEAFSSLTNAMTS